MLNFVEDKNLHSELKRFQRSLARERENQKADLTNQNNDSIIKDDSEHLGLDPGPRMVTTQCDLRDTGDRQPKLRIVNYLNLVTIYYQNISHLRVSPISFNPKSLFNLASHQPPKLTGLPS